MNTRKYSEHRVMAHSRTGGHEVCSRVRLNEGSNTPPVHIDCQDGSNYVGGYLSMEAAEILRRALNDVLEPIHRQRELKDEHEKALEVARASNPKPR